LGTAVSIESGDAGDYEKRVNYFLKNDNIFLSFTSGEMGGGQYIDGLMVSSLKPPGKYVNNADYRLSGSDFGGIRLGITKERFFKSIPKRAILDKSTPRYTSYSFQGDKPDTLIEFENIIPMTKEESGRTHINDPEYQNWYEFISITPEFKNGKLVELTIIKVTSD
jgi:hypothetical protein